MYWCKFQKDNNHCFKNLRGFGKGFEYILPKWVQNKNNYENGILYMISLQLVTRYVGTINLYKFYFKNAPLKKQIVYCKKSQSIWEYIICTTNS